MNDLFPSIQPPTMSCLGMAFLTWRRYLQQVLSGQAITLKQLFLLRHLANTEFINPSEIAKQLYCDRPTATVIINNMRRYGWIESSKNPKNQKFVRISITSAGLDKLAETQKHIFTDQSALFDPLACFDDQELATFEVLLGKLNQHLKQIAKESDNE